MTRQYHGTNANLKPGDLIKPGRSNIRGQARDSAGYVHSTPFQKAARAFAWFKGGRNVYVVEHTRRVEKDPNGTGTDRSDAGHGAVRSRGPMRVIRQVEGATARGQGSRAAPPQGGSYSWRGPAFGGSSRTRPAPQPRSSGRDWLGPAFRKEGQA